MKITQAYEITNSLVKQFIGEEDIVKTDLSNIVDVGKQLLDATDYNTFMGTLSDMFAKNHFDSKAYKGSLQGLVKDGVQYGTIIRKVRSEIIEAVKSSPWDLQDGQNYPETIYHKGDASQTLYNSKDVWSFEYSLPQYQIDSAFSSPVEVASFYSMMQQKVVNSIELHMENLAKATLNGAIAEVALSEVTDGNYKEHKGTKFINLVKTYNDFHGTDLPADAILNNSDLIKESVKIIMSTMDYMREYSKSYNRKNYTNFTRPENRRIVLLNDFKRAADFYLQADTFHNEFTKLPNTETVIKWQGTGVGDGTNSFENLSKISVTAPESKKEFTLSGIIGCVFNDDAVGIYSVEKKANAYYDRAADFTNYWHFIETSCFIDGYENMVVFYAA